jgi:hypothetical protein
MPAGSVAGAAEARLKAQARKKHLKGKRAKSYVYGTMNKQGLMHGNKVTPKGMRHLAQQRKMTGY